MIKPALSIVALSTLIVLALLSTTLATSRAASEDSPQRVKDLVCTLSAFFSVDRAERARKESAVIDGRGLVTCKTDQGFNTEFPIRADLVANVPDELFSGGEIAFSANSSPFVIPYEASLVGDRFSSRPYSWLASSSSEDERTLLFRGEKSDLSIELKLAARGIPLDGIGFTSLRLRSDDEAPDLF